jgi:hypothetical protein
MAKMPEAMERAAYGKLAEIVERHRELTRDEPDFESDGIELTSGKFRFGVIEMGNGDIELDDVEVTMTCRNTGRVTRYTLAPDGRFVDTANTPERRH